MRSPAAGGPGVAATALVALAVLGLGLASPHRGLSDSQFTLALSQSLLETGRLSLDGFVVPPPGRWARFTVTNGRVYYVYPPANAVLSTPVVLLGKALGLPPVVSGRRYDAEAETLLQAILAALLVAGYAALAFVTARLLLPTGWSLLIVTGAVLSTPVWSTASRVIWTHTWSVLLLGGVVWMLVRAETGRGRLPPAWLASCLAWAFFLRPTNAIMVVAVTLYVLLWHRAVAWRYLAAGLLWGVASAGFSRLTLGSWLTPYPLAYTGASWTLREVAWNVSGVLVSPSRGLLVFVPILLFVAYALARSWARVPHRRLAGLVLAISGAHVLMVASWRWWYGGYSYGPRLLTDLVPWLTVLGVLAIRGVLDAPSPGGRRRRLEWVVAAVLLAVGVTIHARGAWSPATNAWNAVPVSVDVRPDRVWDWRSPQFLAGLRPWSCEPPR